MSSILPLPPGVVGEFVLRAHVDYARVAELLASYPTVLNAAFDHGNGDFETALGAAAHSGRRDIVEFLLNKGARIDIFTAAFLGKLALVKAILHETPQALRMAGPHGLTLVDHAKKGGNVEMVGYLQHLIDPSKKAKGKGKAVVKAKAVKPKRRKAA